ncbi:hypothetical protein CYMTET_3198 [Cymbomonas tetramitiformis]|uniref:Methyltransferase domain-containing protein n=1 Tax=Cymbomonas tetramitiformis TaxID=36881 RepID=A0AAE0H3W7_9CHLO|nr:hypothetical protein CYMTET_3198 [Cymbomonas tetramitiformis]
MPDFGSKAYWDERYKTGGANMFDWYMDYDGLKPSLRDVLNGQPGRTILIVGCGNSPVGETLYDEGYQNVTSIDNSQACISLMKTRSLTTRPGLKYHVMDAANMFTLTREEFDLVLDKALLDSTLCGKEPRGIFTKICSEVARVLKPGGTFISFSYAPPEERDDFFRDSAHLWKMSVFTITKPSLQDIVEHIVEDFAPKPYDPEANIDPESVHFIYRFEKAPREV